MKPFGKLQVEWDWRKATSQPSKTWRIVRGSGDRVGGSVGHIHTYMSEVDCFDDEMLPEYLDWSGGVRGKYAGRRPENRITVSIEVKQMSDGQWCAGAMQFPEATGIGGDAKSALRNAEALIAGIVEDRSARGEIPPTGLNFAIDYR